MPSVSDRSHACYASYHLLMITTAVAKRAIWLVNVHLRLKDMATTESVSTVARMGTHATWP